jgi:Na+-driven multidrug efflux pump
MAGVVFPIYFNVYMAYMRALGDSRSPLIILSIALFLNIIFDLLFIIVFKWGMVGAGLATIVSQGFAAVACIWFANRKIPELRLDKLLFDKAIFKLILTYGIPASVQLSITSLASLTIMRLVNSLGAVSVAGFSAGLRVENFALMPLHNINMAISTFVGQNIGAGNEARAKQGLKSGMKLMIGIGVITSVILLALGPVLMGWFVSPGDINAAAIIREGSLYLSIISMFYILFGVFFAFNGFFRGVGDPVIVMILTIVSLTIRAVLAHVFVYALGMGLEAVAWSIPIGWAICGAYAILYYYKGWWRGKVAINRIKTDEKEERSHDE